MGGLTIRRYRPEDLGEGRGLHYEGLYEAGARINDPLPAEDLDRIREVHLAGGGEFLVGTVGGRIVAMGALEGTSGRRAEAKRLPARPAYWRRGYGQAVLPALERRAAELGYRALHLDTTAGQTAARRLYGDNGFGEVRRARMGGFQSIFYEKDLG